MFTRYCRYSRYLPLVGVFVFLLIAVAPVRAALRHVDQTIFGMDCAPCAYGMQQALAQIKGVTKVQVSLNHTDAVLDLAPGNTVTIQKIRQVVRDSGFDPREAEVTVTGELKQSKQKDQRPLMLASGERFILRPAPKTKDKNRNAAAKKAWRQLQQFHAPVRLKVQGTVPRGGKDQPALTLEVQHVEQVKQDKLK